MVHSVEELLLLIEDTEEAGILEPDQADLVENVGLTESRAWNGARRTDRCTVPLPAP